MFFIAIDSAQGLKYSGSVSASSRDMFNFYKEMSSIFSKHGIKAPFHWNALTTKQRNMCRNDIVKLVNAYMLRFNILFHPRRRDINHKDYYLFHVPNSISENLESWIKSIRGSTSIEVLVDDDYNIRKIKNGTKIFVRNFLRQIGLRATGKNVAIREDKKIRTTIKLPTGYIIEFYASVARISSSQEIQIIDIIMGYYLENADGFERDKIFFRKI